MVKHLPTMRETWVQALGWEDPLEKEMATHSRTIAWKIPWTEEPGRLQSMGSHRVRHDWATSLHFIVQTGFPGGTVVKNPSANAGDGRGFYPWVGKIPWRRKRQPTPVLLPGKCYGQRSLASFSPRGCKELDMIEHTHSTNMVSFPFYLLFYLRYVGWCWNLPFDILIAEFPGRIQVVLKDKGLYL